MRLIDLPLIPYRQAWALQEEAHALAADGGDETLFLLEHTPVITFGRRAADSARNLRASADRLQSLGVEIVESDRGGDITFHGPGQLVAYPILRLADRKLTVGAYVHRLEDVIIATLADLGIQTCKDPAAPGVWTTACAAPDPAHPEKPPAKICAIGVRIKRGVSLHGIALNLTTDLSFFDLINPCGLNRPVTTINKTLGPNTPTMPELKALLSKKMIETFMPGVNNPGAMLTPSVGLK